VGDGAVERAGVTDARENRLRRLRIRCWRRGTREMDLILGGFADAGVEGLGPAELDAFEAMLGEDDHALYPWITGQAAAPAAFRELVGRIRRHHRIG
jgi:antitoxin CptB